MRARASERRTAASDRRTRHAPAAHVPAADRRAAASNRMKEQNPWSTARPNCGTYKTRSGKEIVVKAEA